jgi:hypothetical protein
MAMSKAERVRAGLPAEVQYDDRTDAVLWSKAADGFGRLDWLRVAAAALDQALHGQGPNRKTLAELRDTLESIVDEERTIEVDVATVEREREQDGESRVVLEGTFEDVPEGFWGGDDPGSFRMPPPPEYVQCPACYAPPERNYPKGHQYVGSGAGWAKCARCNGTGQIVKETEGDAPQGPSRPPPRPPPPRWGGG